MRMRTATPPAVTAVEDAEAEPGGWYHGGDGKEGDEYNGERRDGERNGQCAYLARVPSQLLHDKRRAAARVMQARAAAASSAAASSAFASAASCVNSPSKR